MEVPQVFENGGRWYCLFCTDVQHYSKAYAASYPGEPVRGTHYMVAADPRGPWQVAPGLFLDGDPAVNRYAARIVDTEDGLVLLGFLHNPGGGSVRGRDRRPGAGDDRRGRLAAGSAERADGGETMADVKLVDLRKSFGSVDIIKGVSLDIKHGEFVVFVGPSGCGKSTLLRMISGLEEITDGDLYIDGKRVNDEQPRERGIAMVFQSYAIFPHMTVRENIGFGLTLAGTPKAEKEKAVNEAARILQMEHLLDRKPSQLSGGQRQRVAIGRSIVRKPKVFLFDEPLSNLDAALRVDMRMEIGKLHHDLDATMIYVTHDQVEAMTLADKIVVLRAGEVMQVGSPLELYHNPANQFVAGFLGSPKMNFLDVEVKEAADGRVDRRIAGARAGVHPARGGQASRAGGRAILGVRPQFLHPGQFADRGHLHGKVGAHRAAGDGDGARHRPDGRGQDRGRARTATGRSTSDRRCCSTSSRSGRIFSRRPDRRCAGLKLRSRCRGEGRHAPRPATRLGPHPGGSERSRKEVRARRPVCTVCPSQVGRLRAG